MLVVMTTPDSNAVPMFDVMPVTGTFRNSGRFCAVCALGGAPAMVVFIQPEQLKTDLLNKVQQVSDQYPALQVFAVVLGKPDPQLKEWMAAVAKEKALRIPLTVLPEGEIPAMLPIDRNAGNNVFFYHGQRPFKNFVDYDFDNFQLQNQPVGVAAVGGPDESIETAASAMLSELGML